MPRGLCPRRELVIGMASKSWPVLPSSENLNAGPNAVLYLPPVPQHWNVLFPASLAREMCLGNNMKNSVRFFRACPAIPFGGAPDM
jgi:hypothetical protein